MRYISRLVLFTICSIMKINLCIGNIDDEVYNKIYSHNIQICEVYDPYEGLNRKIFAFNNVIDKSILIPLATMYKFTTNDYIRNRVGSFLYNLYEPISLTNSLLQGNLLSAHTNFWRFIINSTFGIAGIFDVAAKFGLEANKQSISSTLAHYGVSPGPYIVLPLFGGMDMRDMFNLPFEYFFGINKYIFNNSVNYSISAVKVIHLRESLLIFTNYLYKNSLDVYAAAKMAIHGNSENSVSYPENFKCHNLIN